MIDTLFANDQISKSPDLENLLLLNISQRKSPKSQQQTKEAFSQKWNMYSYCSDEFKAMTKTQQDWYLQLYGFKSEAELAAFLETCPLILDAGCGAGNKAAWFAQLSPKSTVIAIDISNSIFAAAKHYQDIDNLYFLQADLGDLSFIHPDTFSYVSCDQVLHHTAKPNKTLEELVKVAQPDSQLALYVYRKKALPRELLDEHFREFSKSISHEELAELSEQMTQLGKLLSDCKLTLSFPDIPLLGIKGGEMDLQRFIYWNFIKCYWNEGLGEHNSNIINYDWYSPSQAQRYSKEGFEKMVSEAGLEADFFHQEEACYSGRFLKAITN